MSDWSEPWVVTFDDDGSEIVLPTSEMDDPWRDGWTELQARLGGKVDLTGGTTGSVSIDGHTRTFTIGGGPPPRDLRPRFPIS